jgi:hypothetical protein
MSTKKNCSHPLTDRHLRQVVRRSRTIRGRMPRIWAITWRPGDRTGSFLGKTVRPLGSPVMMVQASYPREDGREGIGLFGIAARVDPVDASVCYDDLRLNHHFHRVPFVGARGSILDPTNDGHGRGNGSWLQLALDVDRIRLRAAGGSFLLPTVPTLPRIYFGYGRKEAAKFEVTPALRRQAAASMDLPWTTLAVTDLRRLEDEMAAARDVAFEALPQETRQAKFMEAWDAAFVPPGHSTNNTGQWLLPHEFCTDVFSAVRIFECFDDLVGATLFNPARTLNGTSVPNPAIEIAKEAGIDLVGDLSSLSPEYSEIEQRLIALIPTYRQRIRASASISDQDLLCAICHYEQPVAIEPKLQDLSENEQLRLMRLTVKPHISECCSDEDLLSAIRNPNGPLFASGLCRVQTLHRDVRQPVGAALSFSPKDLGRERVQALLWHEEWSSDRNDSSHDQRRQVVAA